MVYKVVPMMNFHYVNRGTGNCLIVNMMPLQSNVYSQLLKLCLLTISTGIYTCIGANHWDNSSPHNRSGDISSPDLTTPHVPSSSPVHVPILACTCTCTRGYTTTVYIHRAVMIWPTILKYKAPGPLDKAATHTPISFSTISSVSTQ